MNIDITYNKPLKSVSIKGGSDITVVYDSKELVYFSGGSTNGKLNYVSYKIGGRLGTEVARKTLYYDGTRRLQYTEVT